MMIDVFIGTKAQYIKTAPLLRLMSKRNLSYHLIDSGQHAAFAPSLRRELALTEPDVKLGTESDIKSVPEAAAWFLKYLGLALLRPKWLRAQVFSDRSEYCVIHGDTPTTLLSLLMAKRAGKKVAHLEAGLRSYNFFRPFPEELIRVVCMRFSDVLFTPSEWAAENLRRMRVRGEIVNLGQNTNVEALDYSLEQATGAAVPEEPYCLVTIHRVETIFNRRRMRFIVDLVIEIARDRRVVFVLHEPTRKQLEKSGLIPVLEGAPNVSLCSLLPHGEFLALIKSARFIISDGGSIQEESYYLDTPCLVMREESERTEGLGGNARLATFTREDVEPFLKDPDSFRTGGAVENKQPSRLALDWLINHSA